MLGDIVRVIVGLIFEFIAYVVGELIVDSLIERFGCRTLVFVGIVILVVGAFLVINYTGGA
jgi:fucose permease